MKITEVLAAGPMSVRKLCETLYPGRQPSVMAPVLYMKLFREVATGRVKIWFTALKPIDAEVALCKEPSDAR
jgi:hypothetical protein